MPPVPEIVVDREGVYAMSTFCNVEDLWNVHCEASPYEYGFISLLPNVVNQNFARSANILHSSCSPARQDAFLSSSRTTFRRSFSKDAS